MRYPFFHCILSSDPAVVGQTDQRPNPLSLSHLPETRRRYLRTVNSLLSVPTEPE
jgi:hypothetical protein